METKISTSKRVIDDNKLIAEYMGENINLSKWGENWKRVIGQFTTNEIPNYHSSWDWLMPVVEKIDKVTNRTEIRGNLFGVCGDMPYFKAKTSIEAVHDGVVAYIKRELNKKKKTKKTKK